MARTNTYPAMHTHPASILGARHTGLPRNHIWSSPEIRWCWFFLLLNLLLASTEIIGTKSQSFQSIAINNLLNIMPVALILWFTPRSEALDLVGKDILLLMIVSYLISVSANVMNNTRLVASTLFLAIFIIAITRPAFLAAMFRYLVLKAHWFAIAFGGLVAYINYPLLRWNFDYPKLAIEYFTLPFSNPNLLCQPLDIIAILLAAGIILFHSKYRKLCYYLLLIFISNLIFATTSRGGIFQVIIVWLILLSKDVLWSRFIVALWFRILSICIFVLVAGYGLISLNTVTDIWQELAVQFKISAEHGTGYLDPRTVTLDALYQLFDNPLHIVVGKGAGNEEFTTQYFNEYDLMEFSPHNSYVSVLAQFGIIFFCALCVIMFMVLYRIFKGVRRSNDIYLFWLLLACLIHPLVESYFIFRHGVTADIVRMSFLAYMVYNIRVHRC